MGLFDDIKKAAESAYDNATDSVVNWWEDSESAPSSHQQAVAKENSAAGNNATTIPSAQTNTGETVLYKTGSANTPLLIGGGVLVVVLLVFALMLGRK